MTQNLDFQVLTVSTGHVALGESPVSVLEAHCVVRYQHKERYAYMQAAQKKAHFRYVLHQWEEVNIVLLPLCTVGAQRERYSAM